MKTTQNSPLLIIAAVCLIVCIEKGFAIRCYKCNTMEQPECENSPPDKFLVNCSEVRKGSKFQACRKIDQNLDFEVEGLEAHRRVIRQCAVEGEPDRPCYYKAGFGGRVNVCHCFEDKCNSAPTVNGIAAMFSSVLFFLLAKFLVTTH